MPRCFRALLFHRCQKYFRGLSWLNDETSIRRRNPCLSVIHQQSKSQAFPRRASAKGRDIDIKSSLPSLVFTALLLPPRELSPTKDRAGALVWLSHALPRPGCISSAVVICGWTSSGRPGKPPMVLIARRSGSRHHQRLASTWAGFSGLHASHTTPTAALAMLGLVASSSEATSGPPDTWQ